jgi:sulfoxide reductase heme-binding subunit YedZ
VVPHLTIYALSLKDFDWGAIAEDIAKRPFITVGFTAFVLMIPLAITSTKKWIGRLGGKRWKMLHRLVYVSAVLGVVHYYWSLKLDKTFATRYGIAVGLLLVFRSGQLSVPDSLSLNFQEACANAISRDSH